MNAIKKYGLMGIPLILISCNPIPEIDIDFSGNAFLAPVDFSKSEVRNLTFENTGRNALKIFKTSFTYLGDEIILNEENTTCKEGAELDLGESCQYSFVFTPKLVQKYSGAISFSIANTDEDDESEWIVKSFNFSAEGSLNCSLDDSWQERYDTGLLQAQDKMLQETETAKARAAARTYSDGFEIGFDQGYSATYGTYFDLGYDNGYSNGYSNGFNLGANDAFSCTQGFNSGQSDGASDGRSDGDIEGFDDGYDSGFDAFYSSGYADGYSSYSCIGPFALVRPSEDTTLDPNIPNLCEGKGYADNYDTGHFNREYQKFLLRNEEYQRGLRQGDSSGRSSGIIEGERDGRAVGEVDGFNDGQIDGEDAAYDDCFADGYNSSYGQNYNQSYSSGFDEGYDSGANAGYESGFSDGEFDASLTCESFDDDVFDDEEDDLFLSRKHALIKERNAKHIKVIDGKTVNLSMHFTSKFWKNQNLLKSGNADTIIKRLKGLRAKTRKSKSYEKQLMRSFSKTPINKR